MKKTHHPILKDYRNDWYNKDFLELMARRLNLMNMKTVLDVGCGLFHWTGTLAPYFSSSFSLTGIDISPIDSDILSGIRDNPRFEGNEIQFRQGDSESLPFPDSSFDFVTCQTLLIHLKNPYKAIQEMHRVTRKGGVVLISEPNNLAQSIFRNSSNLDDSVKKRTEKVRSKMDSEKLKIQQGNGDNSLGELVPLYMRDCGFNSINCYINDKMSSLQPPYEKEEEQNKIEMLSNLVENYPFNLSDAEKSEIQNVVTLIKDRKFSSFNPTMLILTAGIK